MHGEQEVWERLGGVDLAFTPASFGQANLQVIRNTKTYPLLCKVNYLARSRFSMFDMVLTSWNTEWKAVL